MQRRRVKTHCSAGKTSCTLKGRNTVQLSDVIQVSDVKHGGLCMKKKTKLRNKG
jgi:hypothetical protein